MKRIVKPVLLLVLMGALSGCIPDNLDRCPPPDEQKEKVDIDVDMDTDIDGSEQETEMP